MSELPGLQPLRVPAGWRIDWNNLRPVEASPQTAEHFTGSTHFSAVHVNARCWIDIEWKPERDPSGEYFLRVEYQPWPRTPDGRRRKDVPLKFNGDAKSVHRFATRDFTALVAELERWLEECTRLHLEGN